MHYEELRQVWAELTAPGAPFEVEQVDVAGQSFRAFKAAPASVRDVWLATKAYAEREYFVYGNERVSYAEAHAIVDRLGSWLFRQGVRPGDRVAIAMRNYPEWMLIYWTCVSMGVAAVGMNAWWVAEEMQFAMADARPKVIFADAERLARVAERPTMAAGTIVVAVRTEPPPDGFTWEQTVAELGELPPLTVDPDADACIFYTSGTTGFPKGAQLTHRGCVNNLFNVAFNTRAWALATARGRGLEVAPAPIPRTLITTPFFHVSANNCQAYPVTASGGAMVLMYRWDAGEALRLIEQERVISMSGVPTMAREVINHPDFGLHDTSSLLVLGGGGAQLPPDLALKIATTRGKRPTTAYGMTETCGIVTSLSGDFFVDKPDSVGPAMPTFEAKCVDDDGDEVEPGAIGELCVRGAGVITGYINRPEATAEAIRDGWLHTGDVARIDHDGFIFIADRKKDMVLRGGENIYCAEVETALYRHSSVAEACVFGVPDPRLGEEVGAAIVPLSGRAVTAADLRQHLSRLTASYKIPRFLWILSAPLPKNANGKVLRAHLRDSLPLSEAS